MSTLIGGIAVGGPRDGVSLSAVPKWNGRIPLPNQENSDGYAFKRIKYHRGRYVWSRKLNTWEWKSDNAENPQSY